MYPYNKSLRGNATELRKNMTDEEKHIWYDFLRRLPFPVKRQKIIGNYIVDFYIPSKKLVIEIDGAQHKMPEHIESDRKRDEELNSMGINVLRYSNQDINSNFITVEQHLLSYLGLEYKNLKPHLT